MNERFKFRIFDKINKEMRYDDFIMTSNGYAGELFDLNTSDNENTLFMMRSLDTYKRYSEPMQCTGSRDKNRKLIYEGDIVKINGCWDACGPAGYEKNQTVVKYSKGICGFTPMCNYDCDCDVYHEAQECEVIGNIYENPELLEKSEEK